MNGISPFSPVKRHYGESFDGNWADVGFHVNPDGTVQDVQVLRSSGDKSASWATPELIRIAQRIYSPLKPGTVSASADRTERLTYTSRYISDLDWGKTNIPHRDGIARIETVDLTPEPAAAPIKADSLR